MKESIGTEIRKQRKQRQLSQEEFGRLVGCSQTAISQVENGVFTAVSMQTLKALFKELGLDESRIPETGHTPDRPAACRWLLCSQALCPVNRPYLMGPALRFKPRFFRAPASVPIFCPGCGTPLIDRCPNSRCQALLEEGSAFCTSCGTPLVPVPRELGNLADPKQFVNDLLRDRQELSFPSELNAPRSGTSSEPSPSPAAGEAQNPTSENGAA